MFKWLIPFLIAGSAFAQTCPTRPPGDNSNACASTAFVQTAVPLGAITALTGDVTATGPGSVVATWNTAISPTVTGSWVFDGPVTFNSTPSFVGGMGSTNVINQFSGFPITFWNASNTNTLSVQPPSTLSNYTLILPQSLGASGTVLTSAGTGNPLVFTNSLGTPPGSGANNVVQETLTGVTAPTTLGLYNGLTASPTTTTNPMLYMQRHFAPQLGSESAQTVGGAFLDTEAHGSGNGTPNLGATIGGLFSTNGVSVNQGSPAAPNFDLKGDVVGLGGFAYNSGAPYPGHVITGVWAYALGPTLDATTYSNLPAGNWTTSGVEVNVTYNHTDPGVQTVLVGEGTSVGVNMFNFRATNAGIKDWTFGVNMGGTPNDGNFSNPDVEDWNGFHTGVLIDKYKNYGLLFGLYADTGSYGIAFPTNMTAMTRRPAANIRLGDGVINMGTYFGASFNTNDFWQNGGSLFYKNSAGNTALLLQNPSSHIGLVSSGIAPTLTAGCTGTGSSISGSDLSGTVTAQTGAASTSCTITFGTTFSATPRCTPTGRNTPVTSYTPGTGTLVINFASTTGSVFDWTCIGA